MFKIFYEDITIGDQSDFGSYEVTKEEVVDFATKYDPQPFHINEEIAKQSVFGGLCASGWHTGSMMMSMLVQHMMEEGFASMGSPGLDELKWLKPVMPGDILTVRQECIDKRESKSRKNIGLLKFKTEVFNSKGVTVMSVIANAMILKRMQP
ncbi:MaoC family dehydratase [Temperatibacter marinus]|uniref:MaoC family dehydratase n=1 Tax=Temperatibacter marinus TaxID=1456591 RepID=A0AA52EB32_9PROT|nr:MaoC family dehydratase [Temperatibacter marinus]WND01470.1 MaoC family dehydratase [Temperatibacter marinus]